MLPLPKGPGPVEFVSITDVRTHLTCFCLVIFWAVVCPCLRVGGWVLPPTNQPTQHPYSLIHHPNKTYNPPTNQQELKAGKAYTTLRVARNDAKLAGIRKGKAGKGGDDKPAAGGDE